MSFYLKGVNSMDTPFAFVATKAIFNLQLRCFPSWESKFILFFALIIKTQCLI